MNFKSCGLSNTACRERPQSRSGEPRRAYAIVAVLDLPARALLAILFATAPLGCGASNDGPELSPASGKVTLDGSPVEGAGISFRADSSKGNTTPHIPTGFTDATGKYVLSTVNQAGAPPGWYKVVVIPYSPPPSGGEAPKAPAVGFNQKYLTPETTDLSVEVKADASPETSYDLELTK